MEDGEESEKEAKVIEGLGLRGDGNAPNVLRLQFRLALYRDFARQLVPPTVELR